jgi:hypothetical protein
LAGKHTVTGELHERLHQLRDILGPENALGHKVNGHRQFAGVLRVDWKGGELKGLRAKPIVQVLEQVGEWRRKAAAARHNFQRPVQGLESDQAAACG